MPQIVPQQSPVHGPRSGRPILLATAAVAGVATAAAVALWVHYGTAVFVHTIMAGIAACL
jgi:hypothetical protein